MSDTPELTAADIAGRLNLDKRPRSWRGNCPECDYSRAFSVRKGRDQRPLLYCANGCSQADLARAVSRATNTDWRPPERDTADEAQQRQRKQEAALRLWRGSGEASGTLADIYLRSRGLDGLAGSLALRFRPDCPHLEGGKYPALVAAVQDAAGKHIAIHRTYLSRDGSGKAKVEPPKASLGPVWGGAVRLDPLAMEIVVGEGIESAASAGRLFGLPAWAALSAGNLRKGLVLPPEVRSVVIAADADEPTIRGLRPGQDAARAASLRWLAEGRKVRIAVPDRVGADFNDLLVERSHG